MTKFGEKEDVRYSELSEILNGVVKPRRWKLGWESSQNRFVLANLYKRDLNEPPRCSKINIYKSNNFLKFNLKIPYGINDIRRVD